MKTQSAGTPIMLLIAVGLANVSPATLAQDRERRGMDRDARPMLAGPEVREQRLPGVESGFTMDRGETARMGGQPVSPRAFRTALSSLMVEDAPVEIRLSSEQRERIMSHVRGFESRARAVREGLSRDRDRRTPDRRGRAEDRDRGERQAQAQRRTPRSPENAQGPRGEQARPRDRAAMASDDGRAAMARAMADLQHRVWAELSAAQQAHVGTRLEAHRARMDEERESQMRERYRKEIGERFQEVDERRGGIDRRRQTDAPDGAGSPSITELLSERPESVRQGLSRQLEAMPEERRAGLLERIRAMSPEQRQRLVQRLSQMDSGGRSSRNRP